MQQDLHDDAPDSLSGLHATSERPRPPLTPAASARKPTAASHGPWLWLCCGGLLLALLAETWWSHQQLETLASQLVATQKSFAQISENAAGELRNISGKVVATESNVSSEREGLRLRIRQLETALQDSLRQQEELGRQLLSLRSSQTQQTERLGQQSEQLGRQQEQSTQLQASNSEQDRLISKLQQDSAPLQQSQQTLERQLAQQQEQLSGLRGQLQEHERQLASLSQSKDSAAIRRLEDEVLVLRSSLDTRPAGEISRSEYDTFRQQTTRNITTLQEQWRTLQRSQQ